MLQVVKLVRSALDDFYATLSDEQKFEFEAIGVDRNAPGQRSCEPHLQAEHMAAPTMLHT